MLPRLPGLPGISGLPRPLGLPGFASDSLKKGIIRLFGITNQISRPDSPRVLPRLNVLDYAINKPSPASARRHGFVNSLVCQLRKNPFRELHPMNCVSFVSGTFDLFVWIHYANFAQKKPKPSQKLIYFGQVANSSYRPPPRGGKSSKGLGSLACNLAY